MIANVVSPVAGSQGRKTVDVTLGLPFSHCLSRDHTILDYSVCLMAFPGRRESDSREPRQSGPQEWQVGLACYLLCHPHGEHKVGQASSPALTGVRTTAAVLVGCVVLRQTCHISELVSLPLK